MLEILIKETEGDTEIVRPSRCTCSSAPSLLTAVLVSPHQKVEKIEKNIGMVWNIHLLTTKNIKGLRLLGLKEGSYEGL